MAKREGSPEARPVPSAPPRGWQCLLVFKQNSHGPDGWEAEGRILSTVPRPIKPAPQGQPSGLACVASQWGMSLHLLRGPCEACSPPTGPRPLGPPGHIILACRKELQGRTSMPLPRGETKGRVDPGDWEPGALRVWPRPSLGPGLPAVGGAAPACLPTLSCRCGP